MPPLHGKLRLLLLPNSRIQEASVERFHWEWSSDRSWIWPPCSCCSLSVLLSKERFRRFCTGRGESPRCRPSRRQVPTESPPIPWATPRWKVVRRGSSLWSGRGSPTGTAPGSASCRWDARTTWTGSGGQTSAWRFCLSTVGQIMFFSALGSIFKPVLNTSPTFWTSFSFPQQQQEIALFLLFPAPLSESLTHHKL